MVKPGVKHTRDGEFFPWGIVLPAGLGITLMVAAWFRWQYIVQVQPYPDEFVTLLAVKMIMQKGLPILPSGLFYEHGLLFSYAGAVAGALFGFSRESVRVASLVSGLLAIGLVWRMGRRWFSAASGLLAAVMLAMAPTGVMWAGRARMYALLQVWVILVLYLALAGSIVNQPKKRWLALVCFLGASLTQFVAVSLVVPLWMGMILTCWLSSRHTETPKISRSSQPVEDGYWFFNRRVWLETGGWLVVLVIAFVIKRLGQPKGVAPLGGASGDGVLAGLAQVVAIYGTLSTNVVKSWQAIAAFFVAPESMWLSVFALLALAWAVVGLLRGRFTSRNLATSFLSLVLVVTTLEMVFLASPERRDDKYLFMLLPALCLLAADGLERLGKATYLLFRRWMGGVGRAVDPAEYKNLPGSPALSVGFTFLACLLCMIVFWPQTTRVVARSGDDYDAAFGYVLNNWQKQDAVLTGTPAAAGIYMQRNDYYAVRGTGGYAYRILEKDGQLVDRWMGSPWLETDEQLQAVLSGQRRVWLILERWGLIKEYYSPLTTQRILGMTDFIREDSGIIVLRSRPGSYLIPEQPANRHDVDFENRLALRGYEIRFPDDSQPGGDVLTLDLILYWEALQDLDYDYSVFVHLRDNNGETVAQADHLPLAPVFPPSLWLPFEVVRDRSELDIPAGLPPGEYQLWVGVYRLDTLQRLPIVGDTSGENAAWLGVVNLP